MANGEFLLNTAALLNRFLFDFSEADAHSLQILSVSVPLRDQMDLHHRFNVMSVDVAIWHTHNVIIIASLPTLTVS